MLLSVEKRKPSVPSKMTGTWLLPLVESGKYQQSRKLSGGAMSNGEEQG